MPVWLSSKCHDHTFLFGTEGTGDELLRVISISVLNLLWQSLFLLLTGNIIDRELSFAACSAPLTHGDILLALRHGHVCDRLSVAGTYMNFNSLDAEFDRYRFMKDRV